MRNAVINKLKSFIADMRSGDISNLFKEFDDIDISSLDEEMKSTATQAHGNKVVLIEPRVQASITVGSGLAVGAALTGATAAAKGVAVVALVATPAGWTTLAVGALAGGTLGYLGCQYFSDDSDRNLAEINKVLSAP